jgi:hypothetical protein
MENTYKSFVEEILKNEPTSTQAPETGGANEETQQAETQQTETQTAQSQETTQTEQPTQSTETESSETPTQKEWYDDDDSEPAKPAGETTQTTPVASETSKEQTTTAPPELDDEEVKLLIEYKKSGKSLKDFVQEYNVVDYGSMDDDKILELGLKQLEGFKGDELDEATSEIHTMTLFQKKKLIRDYRDQFEQINQEKLKQLSSYENVQSEAQQATVQRFNTELENVAKSIQGQERYGLKITDEMSNGLKKFVAEEMSFQRADGSLDVEALLDVALWRKYGKELVRANVTRAKNEGREEILRQTTNPSAGTGSSTASAGFSNDNLTDAFSQYLNNKK